MLNRELTLSSTDYGFKFGEAEISALAQHNEHAFIQIKTPRDAIQIRITPSGLIRIARELDDADR